MGKTKGFTLIELIMVIVILGILAAVVVPKFFDFTGQAEESTETAFLGNFKAGINLYASDQLMTIGIRKFPCAQWAVFDSVLDEIPEDWEYTPADGSTYFGVLTHTRKNNSTRTWRYFTSNGRTEYSIQDAATVPPPPPLSGSGGPDQTCN